MAHEPKAIFKAIIDKWEADANLSAAIPTVYLGGPPRTTDYPLAFFMLFLGQPDPALDAAALLTEPLEDGIIRFSLFDQSTSHEAINDIVQDLHTLFDDASLTFTGGEYDNVSLIRTRADFRKDGVVWRWDTDYDFTLQGT